MTIVALANVLLGDRMVARFHADPRVQATELLLQERVPRDVASVEPRPIDEMRVAAPVASMPVRCFRSAHTAAPHTQFLSNGRYVTSITNAGGGASVWRGLPVIRWRRDATCDADGQFIYLRDVRSGSSWSATYQPSRREPDEYTVTFTTDRASFRRRDEDVSTQLDIAVSTEDDVEVRRLTLRNHGTRIRELDVTSYAEIVLTSAVNDLAHPAFGKLFVETEYLPACAALLCHRRPRDPRDLGAWAFHALSLEGRPQGQIEWETDRARFLGRGRDPANPVALDGRALSGTTGLVLDPILSLRQRLRLLPGGWARLCFATGVAGDRQTAEALARKYSDFGAAVQTFLLAETREHGHRWHLSVSPEDVVRFERLASRVLHADRSLRAPRDVVAANTLGQSGLWRHGISGDLPILLVRIHKDDDVGLVRQVLQAQEYWRLKGLVADVVIVNENPSGYLDEMHGRLTELLDSGPWRGALHRPGGAFLLRGDQVSSEESCLLQTAARAVLDGARGDLRAQLDHPSGPAPHRAGLAVSTTSVAPTRPAGAPAKMPAVSFHNGLGGFAAGGRTYAIAVDAARVPPLPWSNVIANARFGTIVSERGSAFTWAGNSRENRLTPFSNDPVIDPTGEAIYVRDDATSEAWTPTPGPMRQSVEDDRVVVTHQPGLSRFERVAGGLRLTLEVFVDAQDPVKFSRLTIENLGADIRRLSVFAYNEWLLGPPQDLIQLHVKTAWDDRSRALFAENPYNEEFGTAVAFAASSPPAQAFTADRRAFIGSRRDLSRPAALDTVALSGDVGAGLDPCAALQVRLPVEPGEAQTVVFVLGQARDREAARALVARHASAAGAEAARAAQPWDDILGAIQVRTPDDSFDVLMNHWLPYQTLGCRVWARTGYHQPGGAFGFRDQLQDVLALCHSRPDIARAHIVRAAGRQFREGDVQHWWHEPSGRGLRSRCSDDLLWLPFAAADYARTTGDSSIFEERVAYLDAPLLAEGAHEAYQEPAASAESGTLFEHCLRAIDKGLTAGAHGLPLIGGGDWNDGMNRVGHAGRGESVWLGFFLFGILRDFAVLCRCRGEIDRAQRYRHEAQRLSHSLELSWDGEWYRRAYYDDGTPIGSAQSDECRIDSLAQSWAVLSDAVPRAFAERAIDAVRARLVNRAARVLPLLEPPFERTPHDPGYIKAYPPGVRENGGQYTHAAVWFIMALARLGHGDEAAELFHMLNPVNHARTREEVAQYKLEPYVMAGDVYSLPPHAGRGGWSWYTGSAGWMYRAGLESLLGFVRRGDVLRINPCVPAGWTEFGIRWRSGETTYDIAVRNPAGHAGGRTSASFDGTPVDPLAIPIVLDGGTHDVQVVLGGDD
jgi:cyclic beta-1,2-glucan synthetase